MTDEAFVSALVADEADPGIPAAHRIFEPFIGSWRLVVRWFDEDGRTVRQEDGEWHFARVLEGRAVQDVWIVPPRGRRGAGADEYEYGTSLRFYDAAEGAWRSTWIGPMRGAIVSFLARRDRDRVVLETGPGDDVPRRWTFSEITPSGFAWSNEERRSGDWRLVQTFEATRA